jgi:hypothetical protein
VRKSLVAKERKEQKRKALGEWVEARVDFFAVSCRLAVVICTLQRFVERLDTDGISANGFCVSRELLRRGEDEHGGVGVSSSR